MQTALFLMLDQYADWEGSYMASQLNQSPDWQVKTASIASSPQLVASPLRLIIN